MPVKKPGDTEYAPEPDLRPLIYWAALALGGTLGYWLGAALHP